MDEGMIEEGTLSTSDEATDRLEALTPPGPDAARPTEGMLQFVQSLAPQGDFVPFRVGSEQLFLAVHPDHIKDVLVTNSRRFANLRTMASFMGNGLLTSEGEFHRRQRRLIQPAFHHTRIAGYGDVMVARADRAASRWQDGQRIDAHQEMAELTLGVVAQTLFDVDIEEESAAEFRRALRTLLGRRKALARPAAIVDAFLYDLIKKRRQSTEPGKDILSMLLRAHDEEGDGSGMTDQQLRDEAITLVVAGHETVANALTSVWHLLSENPEPEARLHAELREVLGGRLPTMDDLPSLQYTEMVLTEAMRLHPPVPMGGRQAIEDHEMAGHHISTGARVVFSQHIAQRDPRWYPDPERFDPKRWTPEARADRPKFAYFPFGGGPRLCIGESFAWMEGKLLIATIARRWRLKLIEGQPVEWRAGITLRRASTPMQLVARSE